MVVKSRGIRWVEYDEDLGGMRNAYRILVRKSEEKGQIGRHRKILKRILDK
jgi:hypothetical protein